MARPFRFSVTTPSLERSPLESVSAYAKRRKKWRKDNATRTGQRRAIKQLGAKSTPIPTGAP